jgi:hypothetical protein
MMNDILAAIALHPKITTRELSDLTNIKQLDLADALNDEVAGGTLNRHLVFVENGTPRPTVCFGWSCPTD